MKRNPSRVGLKWKLFVCFAGFTAVILAFLWVFQIVLLDDFYKFIKTRSAKDAAASIARNINLAPDELQSLVSRISVGGEMCVLVYDLNDNGTRLADSDILLGCMIHKIMPSERYQLCTYARDNGGEYLELYVQHFFRNDKYDHEQFSGDVPRSDPGLYDSLLYIRIVRNSEGHDIAIMMNAAITPVDATVQTLRSQLIIITGAMVVLAAVVAFFLSRSISKPISKLNSSAKVLATGNYDVSFDARGYREISELSDSLAYAAGELSRVDEYRRELIANVSHDMRTPLTLISGYGEVMKDIPAENNAENLDIIIAESKRLTDLVNDMLEQTKYEDGAIHLEKQKFDLSATLGEIMNRYSKFTEQDGYSISSDIEGGLTVCADKLKVSQAIYNLMNNALTYTGEDKKISVTLRRKCDSARVEVTDTGQGIPQDKLAHIWNRYYKIDKAHKRAMHGSGLGLSIVRNIMELHGAAYGADSTVGAGSTFWFELKLTEE